MDGNFCLQPEYTPHSLGLTFLFETVPGKQYVNSDTTGVIRLIEVKANCFVTLNVTIRFRNNAETMLNQVITVKFITHEKDTAS